MHLVRLVPLLSAKKARACCMENFIGDAMVIEGVLFSFLLALFMTWLILTGLFSVLPGTTKMSPASSKPAVRWTAERAAETHKRERV
jgi:hypothetical protein